MDNIHAPVLAARLRCPSATMNLSEGCGGNQKRRPEITRSGAAQSEASQVKAVRNANSTGVIARMDY